MNRKKFFCIVWASVFLSRLWFEGIGNPFSAIAGSAVEGFSLPGWGLVAALRHVAPSATAAHALAIAVTGTVAFWFFPVARLRRCFGTHDAFTESRWLRLRKRLGMPSFWQCAAAPLDTLHRLKLGKGNRGGWA